MCQPTVHYWTVGGSDGPLLSFHPVRHVYFIPSSAYICRRTLQGGFKKPCIRCESVSRFGRPAKTLAWFQVNQPNCSQGNVGKHVMCIREGAGLTFRGARELMSLIFVLKLAGRS